MNVEDLLHPLLSSYLNSPQWVKNALGRAYAAIPIALRKGQHYHHFLAESSLQSEDAIRRLASEKLALTLRHAFNTVPAYRKYRDYLGQLVEPEAVLRQLPLVSKEDIKQNLRGFVSEGIDSKLKMKVFTGGSTSVPMTFYLHKGISRTKEHAFMEQFHRRAGMQDGDVVLSLRGNPVPGAGKPGGRIWMYEPIKKQLILSSDHLGYEFMPEYVRAIREWKPVFIQAYPSAIHPLALWLGKHPAADISERIKGIMLYSENVLDHHMALLKEVFPGAVLKHYGHSERVLMAASMPDDERYFFWPQYGYFELVDQAGNPITQAGVMGEIVGTGFDNQVMPFIRYRTGDMAILSDKPHPHLPGFPIVERIEGRVQEFIVCRDKRLVSVNSLTTIQQDSALEYVEAVQFEQYIPGHLVMRVVARQMLSETVCARIAQGIEAKAHGGCKVDVVQVDTISRTARGKCRMLIQHLDTSDYFARGRKP